MSLYQQLLAFLSGAPTQNDRLLKLHTPLGRDVLLAERLIADEAIGPDVAPAGSPDEPAPAGFRVVVHALSADAHIELKRLVGQPVLVELLTAHSRTQLRPFHGHVTHAALLGADGGLARYRLVIEPWLAFLGQRRDSWVFQDQSVQQIVDEVFADYQAQGRLAPAWRWDLADASVYPKRSLCIQYQETDLQFVQRLLREEGLFYWFEHTGEAGSAGLGSHALVIADHNGAFKPNEQPRVRYTQASAVLREDSLTRVRRARRLQAAALHLASGDYRSASLRAQSQSAAAAGGDEIASLKLADVPGAYAYADQAQGARLALRQMQAIDARRVQIHASGSVRSARAGSTFTLAEHPVHDGGHEQRDRFVTLAVRHRARSNLRADLQGQVRSLLGEIAPDPFTPSVTNEPSAPKAPDHSAEPLYQCELVAQPAATAVRPALLDEHGLPDARLHPRPSIHGAQSALVVGLGEPTSAQGSPAIHTDRDHRIKVQFHWQRGGASSHRLNAPGAGDNAPASDASGTWVRVAQSVAGANWGANFTPRLGQEVLVNFINGDIDRPVVVAVAYNGQGQRDAQGNQKAGGAAGASGNANAWFPGEKAQGKLQGHQHAAVLAGYKSQELSASASGAGGYTQLVFDDTPGAGRVELASSNAHSRLQLGQLIQQSDNQRLQPRGHGIDLHTGAWGALRAGKGLLLATHARPGSTAGGMQLDTREAQSRAEQSQELASALADSGHKHQAKLDGEPEAAKLAVAVGTDGALKSLRATDALNVGEVVAGVGEIVSGVDRQQQDEPKVFDEQFLAIDSVTGEPLVDMAYFVDLPDGSKKWGRTDKDGKTPRFATPSPEQIKVLWGIDAVIAQVNQEGSES